MPPQPTQRCQAHSQPTQAPAQRPKAAKEPSHHPPKRTLQRYIFASTAIVCMVFEGQQPTHSINNKVLLLYLSL